MIFRTLALLPLCAALAFAADAGERRFDCTVVAIHDDASLLPPARREQGATHPSTPSSYRPPSPGVGAPGSPGRHAARQIGDHPRARPRRALPHPRRGLGDPGRLPHLRTYPGCRAGPADHWPGQLARRAGQRPDGRGARPVPVRRGRSAGAQGWPVGTARRRSYRWISANLMPSPRSSPDRVVEPAERHHLVALVDQEITAPAVLLEEHDPFPGQGGIGDDMGRRDLPCRLPVPNLLALHCLPVSCVERRNYRIIGSRGEKLSVPPSPFPCPARPVPGGCCGSATRSPAAR